MSSEEPLVKIAKDLATFESTRQARRNYFKKSLILYGFNEEQAEILVQSLDEFVEGEKTLTEEDKDALYKK